MNIRHMHTRNLQRNDRNDECTVVGDLRRTHVGHCHRLTKRND